MAVLKNSSKFEDNKAVVKSINGTFADTSGNVEIKSSKHAITLNSTDWKGSEAPFTYEITISGMDGKKNWEVTNSVTPMMTKAEFDEFNACKIVDGGQGTNVIKLMALGKKPTMDIHILVIVRGD